MNAILSFSSLWLYWNIVVQSLHTAPSKALRATFKKNGVAGSQNGHVAVADIHIDEDDTENPYYNLVSKNSPTMVKTSDLWSHIQQLKLEGGYQEQYDVSWIANMC